MHAFAVFASLLLLLAPFVRASVYVTQPVQSTTCTGGQSCLVQWTDNGQAPLLADIGVCQVGLYTGQFVLAQSLQSVDVSTARSFSFTPDPAAGPNGQYYLVFTSNSINYRGFSATFTLTGLTGTTPGGGSSIPASTPASASSGSSTPSGASNSATSPATSAPTASGTSTPVAVATTPTGPTPSPGTTPATGTPTLITPTATTTGPSTSTTPATTTSARTSTSASATPTSAASRVGSSMSLGGLAAMFALSCVLAF